MAHGNKAKVENLKSDLHRNKAKLENFESHFAPQEGQAQKLKYPIFTAIRPSSKISKYSLHQQIII